MMETEGGSTTAHPVEHSPLKRLRTCRKPGYNVNDECNLMRINLFYGAVSISDAIVLNDMIINKRRIVKIYSKGMWPKGGRPIIPDVAQMR
jgi:hypothetical protein